MKNIKQIFVSCMLISSLMFAQDSIKTDAEIPYHENSEDFGWEKLPSDLGNAIAETEVGKKILEGCKKLNFSEQAVYMKKKLGQFIDEKLLPKNMVDSAKENNSNEQPPVTNNTSKSSFFDVIRKNPGTSVLLSVVIAGCGYFGYCAYQDYCRDLEDKN